MEEAMEALRQIEEAEEEAENTDEFKSFLNSFVKDKIRSNEFLADFVQDSKK